MEISLFDYNLPEDLIAQEPSKKRKDSRLLVYHYQKDLIEDRFFYEIIDYFKKGDILVLNNTKVYPARLLGKINGKDAEIVVLKIIDSHHFEIMGKPTKKMKIGEKFILETGEEIIFKNIIKDSPIGATRLCYSEFDIRELLYSKGHVPLPPYIKRKDKDEDKILYQTVFAQKEGSVAAPTAGLHFTEDLLHRLREKGVDILYITLHVGVGTFRPVKTSDVTKHRMHYEEYFVSKDVAKKLTKAKMENRRIIATGTTVVRTLETIYDKENKTFSYGHGHTNLYIYPPYKIESIDALITNFHLPKSTLLMLIAAFLDDSIDIPKEKTHWYKIYSHAIEKKYRFYSYGDATFLIKRE